MAGGQISAILGYLSGRVGFNRIRKPRARYDRKCVQISMPFWFKAERLCGAEALRGGASIFLVA
jgi:hypothetical protein